MTLTNIFLSLLIGLSVIIALLGSTLILLRVFGLTMYVERVQKSRSARVAARKITDDISSQERKELQNIARRSVDHAKKNFEETITNLDEIVKHELDEALKIELSAYRQVSKDIQNASRGMIKDALETATRQHEQFVAGIDELVETKKSRILQGVEENAAEIFGHYLDSALREHVSIEDQLEVILQELEQIKPEIIKDVNHGA